LLVLAELYQAFSETPPDNVQRRESLRPTTVLLTLVIEAWARSPLTTIRGEDRVARIRAIIDDMNRLYEEGVLSDPPDTWAWNVLLRCIVDVATAAGGGKSSSKEMGERDKPKMLMQEALDLLKIMKKQPDHRARPNAWSYSTIILAFLELHQLQQALELLHQACAVEKINIDIRTIGRVILTAVSKREGGIKEMNQGTIWLHRLFDACEPAAFESNENNRLIYSGGQPAASLVGAVVAGWSRICNRTNNRSHTVAADALLACQEATALMERMRRMYKAGYLAQGPDDGIMRLVVSCWARFSCSDNPHHVKKKAALKALQYLQEIRQMAKTDSDSRTMLPDLVTYNEVLRCLATAQEPLRAEALLKQMIDDYNHRGTDANTAWRITACFNTVLLGWTLVSSPSNADAVSSRAQGVLDAMQRLPISANRETYHHMIRVWSNAGRPDKAENIFYRMKQAYEKDLTNVKNIKNYAKDHRQHEQQASCSTLQPTTHSFRRIIQAWTAMRSNATCSFNPERAERFLLEMYRWFKSGENDKVCPSPECFRSVAQAWSELATTNCPDGEQQRGFRKRAEYILSLSRDLHQSSPASTK
jgi:pentatricopeptide repeat protein